MTTMTADSNVQVLPEHDDVINNHLADMASKLGRKPSAEMEADMKERLKSRQLKAVAQRTGRILLWVVLVIALFTFAGTALYVNKDKIVTDYDKFGMDTRNCIAKVGERTITGTRTYSYRYMTVLGHKIYMTPENEVKQETRLDVNFNGMTILATSADAPVEKYSISDGVKERPLLNRADSYTFFMDGGKNTAIIPYNNLCK